MTQSYAEIHKRSLEDPEGFWGEAAAGLHWHKPWDRVLDSSNPPFYRWFAGAECNTCYNAVDRHVEGGRGRPARPDLRQPDHRGAADLHLPPAARRRGGLRRGPQGARHRQGRPGDRLYADDPGSGDRNARHRPAGRHPLRRVRRIRRQRTRRADRRCGAEGDRLGLLRQLEHGPGHRLQAAA